MGRLSEKEICDFVKDKEKNIRELMTLSESNGVTFLHFDEIKLLLLFIDFLVLKEVTVKRKKEMDFLTGLFLSLMKEDAFNNHNRPFKVYFDRFISVNKKYFLKYLSKAQDIIIGE